MNMTSFNNDLTIDPLEDRTSVVMADVTTRVLHAPQPQCLCLDAICSPTGNQAIGLNIFRPPAPIFNHPQPHRDLRYDGASYSGSSHVNPSNEHNSTHPCRWHNKGTPCTHELTSQNIFAHFHQYHPIDVDSDESFTCSWITPHAGCCGKKLKVDSFTRHIITHIGIKFRCSVCRKRMAARNDLAAKHRRRRAACAQATFDTITK